MFVSTLFRLGAKAWTRAVLPTTLAANDHFHPSKATCIEAMFHPSCAGVFQWILEIAHVVGCEGSNTGGSRGC